MEESIRCFICLDGGGEVYESDCDCNGMFYHEKCMNDLQDVEHQRECRVCNKEYEKIILEESLQNEILTIIENKYGYIEEEILRRCDILLRDENACLAILKHRPRMYKYLPDDMKRKESIIENGLHNQQFKHFPNDLKNDINICKRAIEISVFSAMYVPREIYLRDDIQLLINDRCKIIACDNNYFIISYGYPDNNEIVMEINAKIKNYRTAIVDNDVRHSVTKMVKSAMINYGYEISTLFFIFYTFSIIATHNAIMYIINYAISTSNIIIYTCLSMIIVCVINIIINEILNIIAKKIDLRGILRGLVGTF